MSPTENVLGNLVRYGKNLFIYDGEGYCRLTKLRTEVTVTFRILTLSSGSAVPSFQVTQYGNKIYPSGEGGENLVRGMYRDFTVGGIFIGSEVVLSVFNGSITSGSGTSRTNFNTDGSVVELTVTPV